MKTQRQGSFMDSGCAVLLPWKPLGFCRNLCFIKWQREMGKTRLHMYTAKAAVFTLLRFWRYKTNCLATPELKSVVELENGSSTVFTALSLYMIKRLMSLLSQWGRGPITNVHSHSVLPNSTVTGVVYSHWDATELESPQDAASCLC